MNARRTPSSCRWRGDRHAASSSSARRGHRSGLGGAGAHLDAPISGNPEFSWTGTLLIIGFAALLGGGVGLAAQARLAGRSRWWTLAVVPGLVLFLSPGMVLAPSFLVGSLAYAQRGRILRAVGWAVIALSIVGSTLLAVLVPEPGAETTPGLVITFLIGFSLMAITLAWAGSYIWRPRPRSAPAKGNPAEHRSDSTARAS